MKPKPFSELNHFTVPICLPSDGGSPGGHLRGGDACGAPPGAPPGPPIPIWPARPSPLTKAPPGPVTSIAFFFPRSSVTWYSTSSFSASERKPWLWIAD